MKLFKFVSIALVAGALTFTQFSMAQTDATGTTNTNRMDDYDDDDAGYGWIGLIGLAGLAGLVRRPNKVVTTDRDRYTQTRP